MGNLSEKTKPQPDYSGRGCIKRLFLLYKRITLNLCTSFIIKKSPTRQPGIVCLISELKWAHLLEAPVSFHIVPPSCFKLTELGILCI